MVNSKKNDETHDFKLVRINLKFISMKTGKGLGSVNNKILLINTNKRAY